MEKRKQHILSEFNNSIRMAHRLLTLPVSSSQYPPVDGWSPWPCRAHPLLVLGELRRPFCLLVPLGIDAQRGL
ncbi:hypothetical protein BpHYR1_009260 [Brachionus plicatilis]|uniref:Uncharacterized protein n=1 Tax=Brachionus plicatilis TaxID=10195 RepID=A0A3M7PRA9_BRAPC|nr:hypothetical protein BpHYR1_009260 [Brachionus plicatilis]